MNNSIFEFTDYKAYLKTLIRTSPQLGHGFKSKIAKALRCQTAYVSQVLNQNANFSLEQGEELNFLLEHTKEEGRFFLLLIQKERAGSVRLRKRFEEDIAEIHAKREQLKERIEKTATLSAENQMRYYSRWYYSAIHIACTIPELQTREALTRSLKLSSTVVGEALEFLSSIGLVQYEDGKYLPGSTQLFLGSESPMIYQLHMNWRTRALQSLDSPAPTDLHYSTCLSVSKKDFRQIKDLLIQLINEIHQKADHTKEEELCSLAIDYYSLIENK